MITDELDATIAIANCCIQIIMLVSPVHYFYCSCWHSFKSKMFAQYFAAGDCVGECKLGFDS